MKNWKVLIGLILVFSLIVAACGGDSTDTTTDDGGTTATTAADDGGTTDTTAADDGGTTDTTEADMMGPEANITLWHAWKENEIESLNDVINAFTAMYPGVTVDVLFVPFDDLQNKVTTDWSTGGGPAVLIDAFDRASGYLDADLLYDMDEIISADVISALNPAAVSAVDYDGFKAGLPQTLKGVVLFRNKTLADAPATLDDMIAADASLEQGYFFSMAHLVKACGGEIADADGNPAFNTDAGVCWLETLAQFPNPTYYTDDDIDTFKAGTNAFAIDGTWNLTGFAEAIGAENLAIDPWPAAGTGTLSGVVQPESIYISNNIDGAELEASVAFVEFFLSAEAQTLLADPGKAGHIPVVAGVEVSDPLLADAVAAFEGGIAQPRFGGCYWGNMDAALQSYFAGDLTAEEALQGAFDIISSAVADEECA